MSMGKHYEWRKLVKKIRRKRLRTEAAIKRTENEKNEKIELKNSPFYAEFIEKQEREELFQLEEELRLSKEKELQWLETEKIAQQQWKDLQTKLKALKQERAKQDELIRQEWEAEQKRIKDEKLKYQLIVEDNLKKLDLIQTKIEEYINYGGDLPEELNISVETNPNKQLCPFFQKTGACRFKDNCSRNHVRPGVSKVILFPSFYSHFSLEHLSDSEYGSDFTLEYEDSETYKHFSDFFYDILPEFSKYGCIIQLKVCYNREPHLRGNVYVEYESIREALRAYKTFQGRWYGGKQLNVEFCNIPSWKAAICGLNFRKKCPKGSLCNFLHVFINPERMFSNADRDVHLAPIYAKDETEAADRNWRWSESPENDLKEKENVVKHSRKSRNKKFYKEGYREEGTKNRSRRSKSPSFHRKRKRRH